MEQVDATREAFGLHFEMRSIEPTAIVPDNSLVAVCQRVLELVCAVASADFNDASQVVWVCTAQTQINDGQGTFIAEAVAV